MCLAKSLMAVVYIRTDIPLIRSLLLLYAQLTAHGCYIVAATLSKIHVLSGVGSVLSCLLQQP